GGSILLGVYIGVLASVALPSQQTPLTYTVTECYGRMMALQCDDTSRIRILEDVFRVALSGDSFDVHQPRRHQTAKCSLAPSNGIIRHTDIVDICRTDSFDSGSGYLATTNFPNEYPPNLHCACSLTAIQDGDSNAMVQLEVVHFVVKYDVPCNDWLEIVTPDDRWRVCGAYRSTVKSAALNLTFHSDQTNGHEGVWVRFSVFPPDSGSVVRVECNTRESHIPYETPDSVRRHLDVTAGIESRLPRVRGMSASAPAADHRYTVQGRSEEAFFIDADTVGRFNRGLDSQTDARITRAMETTMKRRLVIGACVVTVILSLGGLLLLLLFVINRKRVKGRDASPDRLQQRANSMRLYNSISLPSTINYGNIHHGQCSTINTIQQPDDLSINSGAICPTTPRPSYADCSSALYAEITTTTVISTENGTGGTLPHQHISNHSVYLN
ncbi:hypothetical protein LSAT2_004385, partial [Lamellibrachia satsuma]